VDRYLDEIKEAVVTGKHSEIEALVKNAIHKNVDINSLLNDALIAAMDVVSGKFSRNEIFVPEMLLCAVTMKKALEIVKPRLQDGKATARGTIIMCTVKGDLHDIGKNLVGMFLEGAGFDVVDLGVDVSAEQVIEKVLELKPKIIGLSTLLTTTMTEMGKTLDQLEKNGLRNNTRVMVGGAPVSSQFASLIGADGYGKDAGEAVQIARRLVAKRADP
jgi:5-methyltetrahydrofolate--homocysteine methyltransferase